MSPNRRLAGKPAKGTIEKAIEKIANPETRRRQWNKLVADSITTFPEFTLAGIRVVPTSPVHIDEETKMLEVRCFIFDAETDEEIEHPDGRFQFERPPLTVHDGTWRKEGDYVRPNRTENVAQALKQALVKVICSATGRPIPVFTPEPLERYKTDDLGYRITKSGISVSPPEIDGVWQPYGDPPPGEEWEEIE